MKTRLGLMALKLLILIVACVSITEAGLAAMSVDFGSQFMKIALVKPGVPMEIVLNKESRRKTPNLVAIRNGERYFGEAALAVIIGFKAYGWAGICLEAYCVWRKYGHNICKNEYRSKLKVKMGWCH